MVKLLEDALKSKTEGTQSEILYGQWSYDKKLFPTALQAVSNLFPHYSLHDESHSNTIINNIVRVLGKENISKLSAIDIWLILEAAYCHDIGMVVSIEKLTEALNHPKFIEYFEGILNDPKNGLHEFASKYSIKDSKVEFISKDFDIELIDGIKYILAEYFRRIHADRSKDIITNPHTELSLSSPRSVIPPRIFNLLGDICASHTKNFEEVMQLPFSEVGLDIENAHPRFVACLLRVGDLLDLDNNRFSEVMLRTLSKVPVDTLKHKAKHMSIESFRVDKEAIEIKAFCQDYETANITQHWFNYLNSEISSQMINWNNIVPDKELGYLPTIGSLKVELKDYEYIDGKSKPKFTVDTDKALNLLQGAGIYDNPFQAIRELLQNAVDSTLLRIWLEEKKNNKLTGPLEDNVKAIFNKYPLEIYIKNISVDNEYNAEYLSENIKEWEISIRDNGTGLSNNDLKYLMNTGSSSKNHARNRIINEMPNWMKPSGIFGIGFQSIFMLTDRVRISTKDFFNEELQIVELNNPNSKRDGDILIQKKKTSHIDKPGSNIAFNYQTEKIPISYSIKHDYTLTKTKALQYDPFQDTSLDIEIWKILDEASMYANKCPLPLNVYFNNELIVNKIKHTNSFQYYESNNEIEISLHPDSYARSPEIYFKGQVVDSRLRFLFISLEINIHKYKASDILTLNRNELKSSANDIIHNDILHSAFSIITNNYNSYKDEERIFLSMFLKYYQHYDIVKDFNINSFDDWRNYNLKMADGTVLSIDNFLTEINNINVKYVDSFEHDAKGNQKYYTSDEFLRKNDTLIVTIRSHIPQSDITEFIFYLVKQKFTTLISYETSGIYNYEITLSRDKSQYAIPQSYFTVLIKSLKKGHIHTARSIIPCLEKYHSLLLKEHATRSYVHHHIIDNNIVFPYPKMLSPLLKKFDDDIDDFHPKFQLVYSVNEKLIDWVYENRYHEATTKEEIIRTYEEFWKDVEPLINSED